MFLRIGRTFTFILLTAYPSTWGKASLPRRKAKAHAPRAIIVPSFFAGFKEEAEYRRLLQNQELSLQGSSFKFEKHRQQFEMHLFFIFSFIFLLANCH